MLSLKNVIKTYHSKPIINDVSLNVQPGEIAILLGQSGVGKSTILRVLSNLESIDAGSINLNGQAIDFRNVGMVFQDFNLFPHLTILENLTLPLMHVAQMQPDDATKKAVAILQKLNIEHKALSYPSSLSGGQKQRVAIARALCMEPKVLCMDEPTSALDPMLTAEVAQTIMQLAQQNMTILIATHDTSLLENISGTIYLMKDGKIIEKATTQELATEKDSFMHIKNFIQGKVAV